MPEPAAADWIAELHRNHARIGAQCLCGWHRAAGSFTDHSDHFAAQLVTQLCDATVAGVPQ